MRKPSSHLIFSACRHHSPHKPPGTKAATTPHVRMTSNFVSHLLADVAKGGIVVMVDNVKLPTILTSPSWNLFCLPCLLGAHTTSQTIVVPWGGAKDKDHGLVRVIFLVSTVYPSYYRYSPATLEKPAGDDILGCKGWQPVPVEETKQYWQQSTSSVARWYLY